MLDPIIEGRIRAAMGHEEGDRVPIWDYLDNRGIVDHLFPGWTDYDAAMVGVYHALGIDLCRGYGAAYAESDDRPASDAEDASRVSGRTNWVTRHPIRDLDDLKRYDAPPVEEAWVRTEWVNWLRGEIARFEPKTMYVPGGGCGFHATYGLMGQQLFSYAIYDAPREIERIMEVEVESGRRFAKAAADARLGPLYFIGDDIAYKKKLLFSPKFLRKTLLPALKKCIEPLKAAGIRVIYHSDGYLMDILDDLIDAGIDGLNPIEPIAGMDIGALKRRYGKNLILVGNVDCSQVLPLGTVEEVREATRRCLLDAGHGGGLFIGSSSEVTPSAPVENILAFYETCRTEGTYPLQV
jgi:uroporphyrinogen decarboxylase